MALVTPLDRYTFKPVSSARSFSPFMPMFTQAKVSVIIPTLNEEKNLEHVLPKIPRWVHEVIIVDGRSTDHTIERARELWPEVRIVMESAKGKGAALRAGFAAASGDIIVMIDADGSMDPAELPAYIGALMAGADYVKGSRFVQGGGTTDMELHRQLGNWGLMMFARILHGGKFTDLCYGYNAFWTRVVPMLSLDCNGFEIETLMNLRALKAELKIAEVPSFESPRVNGVSNLRAIPDGIRVLKTIVRERFGEFWNIKPRQAKAPVAKQGFVENLTNVLFNTDWDQILGVINFN